MSCRFSHECGALEHPCPAPPAASVDVVRRGTVNPRDRSAAAVLRRGMHYAAGCPIEAGRAAGRVRHLLPQGPQPREEGCGLREDASSSAASHSAPRSISHARSTSQVTSGPGSSRIHSWSARDASSRRPVAIISSIRSARSAGAGGAPGWRATPAVARSQNAARSGSSAACSRIPADPGLHEPRRPVLRPRPDQGGRALGQRCRVGWGQEGVELLRLRVDLVRRELEGRVQGVGPDAAVGQGLEERSWRHGPRPPSQELAEEQRRAAVEALVELEDPGGAGPD